MSRILLTGGLGFIGSNVVNFLVEKYVDYKIVVLDKVDVCSSYKNIKSKDVIIIKGDITNVDLVNHILTTHQIDIIMNFAASTHVDNSFGNSLVFTVSNVLGTHTLLECTRAYGKIKRWIQVSTDETYGESSHINNRASTEDHKMEPTNPYAATKASAEHLVNAYYTSYKIPIIITRSNNIFGPQQFPEKLIPKFITLLSRNEICELHGSGNNKKSYLYIDDLCEAFDIILHKGQIGKVYNIGSEVEYQNLDVWKFLIQIFRKEHPQYLSYENDSHYLRHVADRDFNDRRYWIDSTELKKMGWIQKHTNFYQVLCLVVKWYLENSNHWDNLGTALQAHQVKKEKTNTDECKDN